MWALDCAKLPLEQFEIKYPDERRPRTCLELCESWARGKIKMPIGLPIYELTSLVLKCGIDSFQKPVDEKIYYYHDYKLRLDWAGFLLNK